MDTHQGNCPMKIYHNPSCGTSRKALAMIQQAGIVPEIVLYLKAPPNAAELTALIARLGIAPRALIRTKEAVYASLGLADPGLSDGALIAAMAANPILIERPIVVTQDKAVIGRPIEAIAALLA